MTTQQQIEQGWFFHNHAWHLLHEIIKLIPDDTESLLDAGAGTGIAAAIIGAVYPGIDLYVTDIEEGCREYWRKRNIRGMVCKSEKLHFDDNAMDFVMSSHVLEHVNDPVLFISELIRVAKKRVVIVVPDGLVGDDSHKMVFNRGNFQEVLKAAAMIGKPYKNIHTFPLYHPHINNLIGVIDL